MPQASSVESQPRPDWAAFSLHQSHGVEFRVLLDRDGLVIAGLRFAKLASIGEHAAEIDIDVICVQGRGFVSVDSHSQPFSAGQQAFWPAGQLHRLWTAGSKMETLMVERSRRRSGAASS